MKPSLDRTLKLLWLAIGALLLLFLGAGVVMAVSQAVRNAGAGKDAARVASEGRRVRPEPRAVRYGLPQSVRGTDTRIVLVSHGDGDVPGGYDRGTRGEEGWVNVVFLDGGEARLLLDHPAYIRDIAWPGLDDGGGPGADSPQAWITYVMAVDDSDGDGRLGHRDRVGLYVSDLEGRSLRPVVRPPLRYASHQALGAGRMLVYALEPPAGEEGDEGRMRQRAFLYDAASGRLSPYAALDSAAARAGQILQR